MAQSIFVGALLLLAAAALPAWVSGLEDPLYQALSKDDACLAADPPESSSCALSALQVQKRKLQPAGRHQLGLQSSFLRKLLPPSALQSAMKRLREDPAASLTCTGSASQLTAPACFTVVQTLDAGLQAELVFYVSDLKGGNGTALFAMGLLGSSGKSTPVASFSFGFSASGHQLIVQEMESVLQYCPDQGLLQFDADTVLTLESPAMCGMPDAVPAGCSGGAAALTVGSCFEMGPGAYMGVRKVQAVGQGTSLRVVMHQTSGAGEGLTEFEVGILGQALVLGPGHFAFYCEDQKKVIYQKGDGTPETYPAVSTDSCKQFLSLAAET